MSAARWKDLLKKARRAREADVHRYYQEVFGADFAGHVTVERARQSIIEACEELMEKKPAVAKKGSKTTEGAKEAKKAIKAGKAAEKATKEVAAKKEKAKAEKAKRTGAPPAGWRDMKLKEDGKITILVDACPYRGNRAQRWTYKNGMTVAQAIEKGAKKADVKWDIAKKHIAVK